MQYKEYKDGIRLSKLGMGAMRLPVRADGEGRPIDLEKARQIIDRAMAAGINYYDTAYIYHGGKSEPFLGEALAKYPRNSFYVADKFNLEANPDYRGQFAEQLERLQMEYIDFYLLHGINDASIDSFLTNGCIDYFTQLKEEGKIRNLGFSYHGSPENMKRLLAAHVWDFVQIQLNYYDWYFGNAKEMYESLTEAGIPIMVMEPVHGGMLANMCDESNALLKDADVSRSIASWAIRWVMGLENVQVILSGMTTMEQLEDNLATVSESAPLSEAEQELVRKAVPLHRGTVTAPCTACRYCCTDCPMGLDIPRLLKAYNEYKIGGAWRLSSLKALPEDKRPAACVGCGECIRHCPQSINVPALMQEMAEKMK